MSGGFEVGEFVHFRNAGDGVEGEATVTAISSYGPPPLYALTDRDGNELWMWERELSHIDPV